MGASMDLHDGTWEEYDAVLRPETTARDGSCRWKWLHYGDVLLAFHEPTAPRPVPETPAETTCLACGKREGEHYSLSLHEGEDPISVCAPGQYRRRWRALEQERAVARGEA